MKGKDLFKEKSTLDKSFEAELKRNKIKPKETFNVTFNYTKKKICFWYAGETFSVDMDKKGNTIKGTLQYYDGSFMEGKESMFSQFAEIVKKNNYDLDKVYKEIMKIKNVPPKVSEAFRKKYDPEGMISPKEALKKFMDDVKKGKV